MIFLTTLLGLFSFCLTAQIVERSSSVWQTGTKSNTSLTFQGGFNDDQGGSVSAAIANVDNAFDFDITCISLD